MIIKSKVVHKVDVIDFSKYWMKRIYNFIPYPFVKSINSDIPFALVVGCGHSGTTLMAAKLSNHSSVLGIGRETNIFARGHHSLLTVRAVAQEWIYFSEFYSKGYILEKTPKHIYSYKAVQKILPNNKFIVMTRNPLDTIASLYKRFGDLNYSIDRWLWDNTEALKLQGNSNVLFIRYEEFTNNPQLTLEQVTDFLGLTFESSMLENKATVYTKTAQKDNMKLRKEQVSKPILPNEGGWKVVFNTCEADKIREETRVIAEKLGYTY